MDLKIEDNLVINASELVFKLETNSLVSLLQKYNKDKLAEGMTGETTEPSTRKRVVFSLNSVAIYLISLIYT